MSGGSSYGIREPLNARREWRDDTAVASARPAYGLVWGLVRAGVWAWAWAVKHPHPLGLGRGLGRGRHASASWPDLPRPPTGMEEETLFRPKFLLLSSHISKNVTRSWLRQRRVGSSGRWRFRHSRLTESSAVRRLQRIRGRRGGRIAGSPHRLVLTMSPCATSSSTP